MECVSKKHLNQQLQATIPLFIKHLNQQLEAAIPFFIYFSK